MPDQQEPKGEAEAYVSKIPGINRPKPSFYRQENETEAIYKIWPVAPSPSPASPGPSLPREACSSVDLQPGAEPAWAVQRLPCEVLPVPAHLGTFPSRAAAERVVAWCLTSDATIVIAHKWLTRGDAQPLFNLVIQLQKLALDTQLSHA